MPSVSLPFLILLSSFASAGFCAKILVYSPSISNSHLVSNGRIADLLVKNGHEVVSINRIFELLTGFKSRRRP